MNRRALSILSLLLALALPVAVSAATSPLAIKKFSGPKAKVSQGQLSKSLCKTVDCVDAKKSKKAVTLSGAVKKVKKKLTLDLSLKDARGSSLMKRKYSLGGNGKLSSGDLKSAAREIREFLVSDDAAAPSYAGAAGSASPAGDAGAAAAAAPMEGGAEGGSKDTEHDDGEGEGGGGQQAEGIPAGAKVIDVAQPGASSEREPGEEADSASVASDDSGSESDLPLFRIAVGAEMFQRSFGFEGVESRNLKTFSGFPLPGAAVGLELYPLSKMSGIVSGLGVDADFGTTLGMVSEEKTVEGVRQYPTRLSALSAGVTLKVPIGDSGFAVTPRVGFAQTAYSIDKASDGTEPSGIPAVSYSSVSGGVAVETALLDDKLELRLGGGWLQMLSGGDILSDKYFPEGSGNGFEVGLRAAYRVTEQIDVWGSGRLQRYGLSFTPKPDAEYVAKGASDLVSGFLIGAAYRM